MKKERSVLQGSRFPLIPLPIKEAVHFLEGDLPSLEKNKFPLIPLPIKEAVFLRFYMEEEDWVKFPLIPLPIKEAVLLTVP